MKIKNSIIVVWQDRFPNLSAPWTHWWIEGDGTFLDIIAVEELGAAVNVVKNNWQRFDSIIASQARYKEDGSTIQDKNRNVVIYCSRGQRNVEET